jgi:CheY-like chemotaxis protein
MATPILVVDDSAVSRSIVIRSLPPEWDVAISQASNGSEALAVLDRKPQEVVLLDLNMPIMDGYQFLEALHARSADGSAMPVVIVLSGDVQPKARARVAALGARAFVGKPIRAQSVLAALKESGVL